MQIRFFFRHKDIGFSIQHVFNTLITEMEKHFRVDSTNMPSARSFPWHMLRNTYYTYKHRKKQGVNHITGHIHDVVLGLIGCKSILTIHDLVFIDNVKNPIKRFYKWFFWLYLPIKLANKVTCISTHTKDNILKYIKTNKIQVIYNPLDPQYRYVEKAFNSTNPVILHIGTGWNKNLKRTIEALHGIPCHLRILGKIHSDIEILLKEYQVDYSSVHDLTNEEVRQEYIDADIISFPSLYEGFGMPVIEGQATGRPVLTSYIEPLIEVSGNAVEYVDPKVTNSIRRGFQKIIDDANYRDKLITMGKENIERFHVQGIVQQYVSLYEEVLLHDK